jgi:hypothetical protein
MRRRTTVGSGRSSVAGSARVAAIVGSLVLLGLIGYGVYRMRAAPASNGTAPAPGVLEVASDSSEGSVISAVAPVLLSPEARVAAERYRCVCGCNDPLGECTCTQSPGSVEMKEHLEALVEQHRSVQEVDQGMIDRYGEQVLLSNPPATPD